LEKKKKLENLPNPVEGGTSVLNVRPEIVKKELELQRKAGPARKPGLVRFPISQKKTRKKAQLHKGGKKSKKGSDPLKRESPGS